MIRKISLLIGLLAFAAFSLFAFSNTESYAPSERAQYSGVVNAATSVHESSSRKAKPSGPKMEEPFVVQAANLTRSAPGFGHAVDIDGDIAVVGAPQAERGKGAVYVYVREGETWRETSRLVARERFDNDAFGQSVSVSDETIIVGASGHDALGFNTGAVYIFQNEGGNWVQTQKLLPSSPGDIHFGWAVEIDGDTIVVGAPFRNSQGEIEKVGAVTIFTNEARGWVRQARLTSGRSGGAINSDLFGWAVAVKDSTLAVGAHLAEAVYIYHLSNGQWKQEAVLRSHRPSAQFGYSVSLTKDAVAIGAPATNEPATRSGAAFVFVRQKKGWIETGRMALDGLQPGARFGWSVALHDNFLAVGARESDGRADLQASGTVHAFQIIDDQITFIGEFFASEPAPFDYFGHSLAISTDFLLVGAPGRNMAPGEAHFIKLQ